MTQLIPRDILFGNPQKMQPRLAPDGRRMAYLAPYEGVLNVYVKTVGQDDDRVVTNDRDRGIRAYFWAEDNEHLLYIQDKGGDENWRLYRVNLAAGETTDLTPFENVQAQILESSKHFPHELLIGLNKEDERLHDVYHVDLRSGELERVAKNPGNVSGWVVDADFKVRGAMFAQADGSFDLKVRPDETADWQLLAHWGPEDALSSGPVAFTQDGRSIYLRDSRDANAARLTKAAISTGETEVIAEDPQYDVDSVMVHPDTYEVQAVAFVRARSEWEVLDQTIAADFAAIRALDHGDFSIVSRDRADKTWLVAFTADNGPVAYYAYDRPSGEGTFLFYHKPELKEYSLAEMEPISFTARDGLVIHGYITFPPGTERQKLPLVLNVHGGPWARNAWGLDTEAQWLANRGYVCLQVNFRGSTGYGKAFLNAGDREWGARMHDDLVDAVDWAVAQGYADPDRLAIYGGSYGGYAALVGATFTPDLFCCAVDIVGPSNLVTLINSIPPYWSTILTMFHQRMGNPQTEAEFLMSRSPLSRVDQIKIPLLIAQGANDPRVKQAESEQIVAAMEEKGIPYEYLLFPDEGHGFARPENRLKFYAAAEKFLAQHLSGRFET